MINFLYVFLGGGIGSCLRYSFSLIIPYKSGTFPFATLGANLLSCLIIGILIGSFSKSFLTEYQKMLMVTGFCGGFSTFSTFGAEIYDLIKMGNYTSMSLYILVSIVFGVALVLTGMVLTQSWLK